MSPHLLAHPLNTHNNILEADQGSFAFWGGDADVVVVEVPFLSCKLLAEKHGLFGLYGSMLLVCCKE
jgi:hypothetical protein